MRFFVQKLVFGVWGLQPVIKHFLKMAFWRQRWKSVFFQKSVWMKQPKKTFFFETIKHYKCRVFKRFELLCPSRRKIAKKWLLTDKNEKMQICTHAFGPKLFKVCWNARFHSIFSSFLFLSEKLSARSKKVFLDNMLVFHCFLLGGLVGFFGRLRLRLDGPKGPHLT